MDSITIIQAHKHKGHGVHPRCLITNKMIHLAGILFIDDTDLEHFDLNKRETVTESYAMLQESIINWGCLLIVTGGALKPAKCFYHMISFTWKADGSWSYKANENIQQLSILVPVADSNFPQSNISQ